MRLHHGRWSLLCLLLLLVFGAAQSCDDDDESTFDGPDVDEAFPTESQETVPDNDDSSPDNAPPPELIDAISDPSSDAARIALDGLRNGSINTVAPLEVALLAVLNDKTIDPGTVTELESIRALDDANAELVALIDDTLARGEALGGG